MSATETQTPTATHLVERPKRADALRNYEKLIVAAREAFTQADRGASLEDIARRAGVGIGTLYRNFPTRAALIEAVYVDGVEGLANSASELAELEPWDALTTWLHRFVGYATTKQALMEELFATGDQNAEVFATCRIALVSAGEPLLKRAQEAGVVRTDTNISEVIRLVGGIARMPATDPADIERLLTVALDGLRYKPS
jgi:AcrR family transcriptional regulator